VVGGDEPVALVDLGCPPAAGALQEPCQAGIGTRVRAQDEAHPVAARFDLAALAGAVAGLFDCLGESFRPRGAELDRQHALHPEPA
jgi:hypothetical protein